jgi:hypothetical protein
MPFAANGSGLQAVSQIDLAIAKVSGPNTFYASLWTNVGGTPGTQVANAFWNNLSTNILLSTCCDLVTIGGISGVTLAGGQQYYLILGPVNINDASLNFFDLNSTGASGTVLYMTAGGAWTVDSSHTLGAFDVLSTPEPSSILLLGTGLSALFFMRRKQSRH